MKSLNEAEYDIYSFLCFLSPRATLYNLFFLKSKVVKWNVNQYNFAWHFTGDRIPLKPALRGICSLANYSVAYGETQSNRVSDFRDFLCVLRFQRQSFFFFLL